MSTEELKAVLHQKIDGIDDKETLLAVEKLLRLNPDVAAAFPPQHVLDRIEQGRKDAEAGRVYTTEQVMATAQEWLESNQ